MSWREALMSLQLLAELRVGEPGRQRVMDDVAREDAMFQAGVQAVTGVDPRGAG